MACSKSWRRPFARPGDNCLPGAAFKVPLYCSGSKLNRPISVDEMSIASRRDGAPPPMVGLDSNVIFRQVSGMDGDQPECQFIRFVAFDIPTLC